MGIRQLALVVRLEGKVQKTICLGAEPVCGHHAAKHTPHKVVRVPDTKREKPVSPGAGKSMLAARLPSILPPLAPAELLEVSMVASVAGQIEGGALTNRRPF